MDLNNREIALLIFLGVALLAMAAGRDTRSGLVGVLKAFFVPTILVPFLTYVAILLGWIYLGSQVGLWQEELASDAMFWFMATGLGLFIGMDKVYSHDDFFLRGVRRVLTIGLVTEAVINFVVLPLIAELVLLVLVTSLVGISAVAEGNPDQEPAKKAVDGLLAVIGIGLLIFVVGDLVFDPDSFDTIYGVRAIFLPIWLTLASLPFIYLVGLYAAYNRAFTGIDFIARDQATSRRSKRAMLFGLGIRARQVGAFTGPWQRRLVDAESKTQATSVVVQFRAAARMDNETTEAPLP